MKKNIISIFLGLLFSGFVNFCNAVVIQNYTTSKLFVVPVFKLNPQGYLHKKPLVLDKDSQCFANREYMYQPTETMLKLGAGYGYDALIFCTDASLIIDFLGMIAENNINFAHGHKLLGEFQEKNKDKFTFTTGYCSEDTLQEWKKFFEEGSYLLCIEEGILVYKRVVRDKEEYYWLRKQLVNAEESVKNTDYFDLIFNFARFKSFKKVIDKMEPVFDKFAEKENILLLEQSIINYFLFFDLPTDLDEVKIRFNRFVEFIKYYNEKHKIKFNVFIEGKDMNFDELNEYAKECFTNQNDCTDKQEEKEVKEAKVS